MLAKGWTLGSAYLLPCMHGVIRLYHRRTVDLLARFWRERRPDLVVSLVPNFNRAMFQSLEAAFPGVPFVTILTDLADYPPHFWMERQDQYLICGTERAIEQAKQLGFRDGKLFRTSGMILRPQFYELAPAEREAERAKAGLDPRKPTALVLFGGEGSNAMFSIAKRLGNGAADLQMILICGRNESLRGRLEKLETRNQLLIEGFTKEIPRYMQMADFFIGKPGPGSISEALHMGLPVIVERNAWTLPQERYNAEWIAESGFGIVLRNFREIEPAVRRLLTTGQLGEMRQRIAKMKNRAVFEIPPILERILREARDDTRKN
jgi:1,2-diacylglycerol 3-beta-galactosyltransferase